jgi:hypothetical protein
MAEAVTSLLFLTRTEKFCIFEGAVLDAIFDDGDGDAKVLSSSLDAFLERLQAETAAFVRASIGWKYMV